MLTKDIYSTHPYFLMEENGEYHFEDEFGFYGTLSKLSEKPDALHCFKAGLFINNQESLSYISLSERTEEHLKPLFNTPFWFRELIFLMTENYFRQHTLNAAGKSKFSRPLLSIAFSIALLDQYGMDWSMIDDSTLVIPFYSEGSLLSLSTLCEKYGYRVEHCTDNGNQIFIIFHFDERS